MNSIICSKLEEKEPIAFLNNISDTYYMFIPIYKIPYFILDLLERNESYDVMDYIGIEYKFHKSIRVCGFSKSSMVFLKSDEVSKLIMLLNPEQWSYQEKFFSRYSILKSPEEWFNFYLLLEKK